jgi:hypothetical protein
VVHTGLANAVAEPGVEVEGLLELVIRFLAGTQQPVGVAEAAETLGLRGVVAEALCGSHSGALDGYPVVRPDECVAQHARMIHRSPASSVAAPLRPVTGELAVSTGCVGHSRPEG